MAIQMQLKLQVCPSPWATKKASWVFIRPRDLGNMMTVAASHATARRRAALVVESGGRRKTTERMITTLQRSRHDVRAVRGNLRRLSNQSKRMQIQILQQLLDEQDWQLALPMYKSLMDKEWYKWSPTLHARLLALLAFADKPQEAEVLVSELPAHLRVREKLALQVCLIESYAEYGLLDKALATFHGLHSHSLPLPSIGRLSHQALLRAYISLNLPDQARLVLEEMKRKDCHHPCLGDYKALLAAFGRAEHFSDMEKVANDVFEAGLELDQSGFNMMLCAYGQAGRFDCISATLKRMNGLSISSSVNTHNAISKSCPTLVIYFDSLNELPENAASLCSSLQLMSIPAGELGAVRELLALGLPPQSVTWEQNVWELDMHQMFLGTASIALFLWLQQIKARCLDEVPPTIRVVTGWGKHSDTEGRSVLKQKVLELLERLQSPFRIDSHNRGVLTSRGTSFMNWLATDPKSAVP